MTTWKVGQKVKFIGCSSDQVRWGNNTDPTGILVEGHEYELEDFEVHTWHTKLYLKGIEGRFNSVCFVGID